MNFRRERNSMAFYIVFGSVKRPVGFMGDTALDWGQPPIGVYSADSPEDACQTAARDHGQMATYFAVEGTPWGVDMVDAPAKQLGRTQNSNDRLADVLDRMQTEHEQKIKQLEAGLRDDPSARLAAAEAKTRQMERDAGIEQPDSEEY